MFGHRKTESFFRWCDLCTTLISTSWSRQQTMQGYRDETWKHPKSKEIRKKISELVQFQRPLYVSTYGLSYESMFIAVPWFIYTSLVLCWLNLKVKKHWNLIFFSSLLQMYHFVCGGCSVLEIFCWISRNQIPLPRNHKPLCFFLLSTSANQNKCAAIICHSWHLSLLLKHGRSETVGLSRFLFSWFFF